MYKIVNHPCLGSTRLALCKTHHGRPILWYCNDGQFKKVDTLAVRAGRSTVCPSILTRTEAVRAALANDRAAEVIHE